MKLYWLQLKRPQYIGYIIGALCLIGGLILFCQLCGITLCPLRKYTGIPCFTCGSTRAVLALLSGELKTAFLAQPLVISLLCYIAPVALFNLCTALLHKRLFMVSLSRTEKVILCLVLVTATLLNWLYLLSTSDLL